MKYVVGGSGATSGYEGCWNMGIVFPTNATQMRLRTQFGNGGSLIVKFEGNLMGDEVFRVYWPLYQFSVNGDISLSLDPRRINISAGKPIIFSLIVLGPPGAWGQIYSCDFTAPSWEMPAVTPGQATIAAVDLLPNFPTNYKMLNWRAVCRNFDALTYDPGERGPYLPLVATNGSFFSQASYVGDYRVIAHTAESINSMFSLVSASVVGIDKACQNGVNWIQMADAWISPVTRKTDSPFFGHSLLTDNYGAPTPDNFWYDLLPTVAYSMLVDLYPGRTNSEAVLRASIDTLALVHDRIKNADGIPNYNFPGFNYDTGQPSPNGAPEPDNAGLAAWIFYSSYKHFGDTNHLARARECFRFLDTLPIVPTVETGLPWGACTAARMNAELGTTLDADRLIQQSFDGLIFSTWGDNPIAGLWAGNTNGEIWSGGKVWYYESCLWTEVANVARYNPGYARAMGKYLLHLANSARIFFPAQVPPECQTDWNWSSVNDPGQALPYEQCVMGYNGHWAFDCSDALWYKWNVLGLSVYSGAASGFIGGRVANTEVPGVLQTDLLAFDTFHDPAYPTFLFYNPFSTNVVVKVNLEAAPSDLLNIVTEQFVKTNVAGPVNLSLSPDSAAIIVAMPAGASVGTSGSRMFANGRVVNYRHLGLDVDSDGLPDWWESRFFGNATNGAPTGIAKNGHSNRGCYLLGLNPSDSKANLTLQIVIQAGTGRAQLSWPTVGGKSYSIYCANHVSFSNDSRCIFSASETNVPVGIPGRQVYLDTCDASNDVLSLGPRFYRVQLQP